MNRETGQQTPIKADFAESPKEANFEYKPERHGLEKVLGPLESEIMEQVWERGKVSVREVLETLNSQTGKNLAYTTVMTIMSRLADKHVLRRLREGGAYIYEATSSRHDFSHKVVRKVIDSLLDDFSEPALAHFVDKIQDIDPQKLQLLEQLIAERKKER